MLILEEPYISRELAEFAARSGEAVLDNASAREAEKNFNVSFSLLDDAAFAERCSRGERLYTNSENALDWLYTYSKNQELIAQVERLKDKVSMRRALHPCIRTILSANSPWKRFLHSTQMTLYCPVS